jgi:hypothetical protein
MGLFVADRASFLPCTPTIAQHHGCIAWLHQLRTACCILGLAIRPRNTELPDFCRTGVEKGFNADVPGQRAGRKLNCS